MGKYHKRIQVEGSDEFDLAVNITGKGAPTEDTEAEPGMVYMDEDSENGDLYKCISRTETEEKVVHTWKKMPSQEEVDSLSEAIEDLKQNGTGGSGLTAAQISALDGMFKITSYTKDPTAEYAAFKVAFGIEDSGEVEPDEPETPDTPEVTLTSISATYSGGDVAVGTALTALTGIVVTATYSDGSTATVTGYTLSGEIAEGSNTITVSYGGKTTTFTVTGVAESGGEDEPDIDGEQLETFEFTSSSYKFFDGDTENSNLIGQHTGNGKSIYTKRCSESDTTVTVVYTNDTDSPITFTAFVGSTDRTDKALMGSKVAGVSWYSVKSVDNKTLAAGESMSVSYMLRAGYHLHAYTTNADITTNVFGTFDLLEFTNAIALTANGSLVIVYSDAGETKIAQPGGANKYQSDVFEEDTRVRVTLYSETQYDIPPNRNFICSYDSGNAGYYGFNTSGTRLIAGVPITYEHVIKAGHRLATCIVPQYLFIEEV